VPPSENVVLVTWNLWFRPSSFVDDWSCAQPRAGAATMLRAMMQREMLDFMFPPLTGISDLTSKLGGSLHLLYGTRDKFFVAPVPP